MPESVYPHVDGVRQWYPISEGVRLCRQSFRSIRYGPEYKSSAIGPLFVNESDRFDTWCYNFRAKDIDFDLKLRKSPNLSRIVFQLFDRILDRLSEVKRILATNLPIREKRSQIEGRLTLLRHTIDKLVELSPALEYPAIGGPVTSKVLSRTDERINPSITTHYTVLSNYKTLIFINNSISLQGWRWDLTGSIVVQAAKRLPRNIDHPPMVKFSSSPPGRQETTFSFEEVSQIFCDSIPSGTTQDIEGLKTYLSAYVSRVNYSSAKPLNLIYITADGFNNKAVALERVILDIGKELRTKGAQENQIRISFVQLGSNPFITRAFEWLRACISDDKAIRGTIQVEVLVIEGQFLSESTYERLLVGQIGPPKQRTSRSPSPDRADLAFPCNLVVDRLTSYTDDTFLIFCFSEFGPITQAYTEDNASTCTRTGIFTYTSQQDAEHACTALNGSRFDGAVISVYIKPKDDSNLVGIGQREDQAMPAMLKH